MTFIAIAISLMSVFGVLLWFTGWAEHTIIDAEPEPSEVKTQ